MPYTDTDDVSIYYEVDGDPADPVIVLIAGGGAQLLTWRDPFRAMLVDEGFRVVRFDNRDVGYSQRFGGEHDLDGGYSLGDMGDDVVRVLDHLGVEAAHLVGHSMGGMMAQMVALEHPERVLSLGLLSTIPGQDPRYILHGDRAELQVEPERYSREESVAAMAVLAAPVPGARYQPDTEWEVWATGEAYDRGYAPEGFSRQWAALLRAPERLDRLREVTVPTLVLHGREDDVLHWSSAVDIAQAMPAAELHVLPDMGHLIPAQLWPTLVAGVVRTARHAETLASGR
ncbi:alpha/beta hydrolase [Plantibacter flavus]|uniref:alpha/beta fold hydrolase n=1 Tax=Plantibacter flavus TaxID=150123 RepID=UPI0010C1EF23|nr:alpha/beta hydrolase [Plantibacter flavus]TKJ99402.1 alpha/beta hydrolase [Plantibacter flavus]